MTNNLSISTVRDGALRKGKVARQAAQKRQSAFAAQAGKASSQRRFKHALRQCGVCCSFEMR
jgi:hypothetical protein